MVAVKPKVHRGPKKGVIFIQHAGNRAGKDIEQTSWIGGTCCFVVVTLSVVDAMRLDGFVHQLDVLLHGVFLGACSLEGIPSIPIGTGLYLNGPLMCTRTRKKNNRQGHCQRIKATIGNSAY
ncbi:MAG: hypothetical protein JOS17DRAFT_759909 [Linnemannia elongata]|nr:MAG: hypothetical protein JOS17DRAFT_759909 [Linnemannia elongata]